MGKLIALLRGINVGGGKTILPMAKLRAIAEEAGFEDAQTLLQSGNLVVEAGARSAGAAQIALEAAIETATGRKVEVMVRTPAEWSKVVKGNPFGAEAKREPNRVMVLFMKEAAPAAKVEACAEGLPEKVKAAGREAYVHYPVGQGVSKLKLPRGTTRNWNTVLKLAEMTKA